MRWRKGHLGLYLFPLLISSACADAGAVVLPSVTRPVPLSPLPIETRIEFKGTFRPSGVASRDDCTIVVAGRTWGTLLELAPNGVVRTETGHTRTNGEVTSLEAGSGSSIVVWGKYPALLGTVGSTLDVRPLSIPEHPWGGRPSGPTIPLPRGRFAIAALSDRRSPVPSPEEWRMAPLAQVIDSTGLVVGTVGAVANKGGRYKSWLAARAVLGGLGDTVLVLRISDGMVISYVPDPKRAVYKRVAEVRLPRYLDPPPPREEVVSDPWITVRGDRPLLVELPQVETAAFGGDRLYAIRAYAARQESVRHPRYETDVRWTVLKRGLEVYSISGEVLAAFSLPIPTPSWLRADSDGRIFLNTSQGLLIARDPTRETARCPRLPPVVQIDEEDKPFRPT